jgi:hypothetical protein
MVVSVAGFMCAPPYLKFHKKKLFLITLSNPGIETGIF